MSVMNKLPVAKRFQILSLLCEGMSMRAVARVVDVSFNTVAKALIDAGAVAAQMHDELVQNVTTRRVQCDEIWAFNYCKERTVATAKAAPAKTNNISQRPIILMQTPIRSIGPTLCRPRSRRLWAVSY